MEELWNQTLLLLKDLLGSKNFDTWIAPVSFVCLNKTELRLKVPNRLFRDWVTEHFLAKIEEAASSVVKQKIAVTFEIGHEMMTPNLSRVERPLKAEKPVKKDEQQKILPNGQSHLAERYTFDSFVIGGSNQFAHAASLAVATRPGVHYNPLFIYGGVGLGKTHLVMRLVIAS